MTYDIQEFQFKCAEIVGNCARNAFITGTDGVVVNHNIKSPIEQIFYYAICAFIDINSIFFDDFSIIVTPQYKIGKYRVDFLVTKYSKKQNGNNDDCVIVECDSQEFHERTEKERRYEKSRDRFFQIHGYKVFHYTGHEIIKNPFIISAEIISYLTGTKYPTLEE